MHVKTAMVVAALGAVVSPALGQLNYVSQTRSVSAFAWTGNSGTASAPDFLPFVRGLEFTAPNASTPSEPLHALSSQASSLQSDWLFVNGSLQADHFRDLGGGVHPGASASFTFDVSFSIVSPIPFRLYGSFTNQSTFRIFAENYEIALTRNGTERIFWKDAAQALTPGGSAHMPGSFDVSGVLQPGSYQLLMFLRENAGGFGAPGLVNKHVVGGGYLVLEVPGAGTLAAFAPLGLFGLRRRRD